MSAASRSKKVLNVATATPPRFFLRAPYSHGLLRRLVTMVCEKCRLMAPDDANHLKELRMGARTGRPIGNDSFLDKLELLTGKTFRKQKPGPKPRN